MPRTNSLRFAELKILPNVYELDDAKPLRNHWHAHHFGNDRPIVLELGCGKAEHTLGMARLFPQQNYIGIDYKGNRIWKGATNARAEGLDNIAFLRCQIEHLEEYIGENEVNELWVTFPDPQPRDSRAKKRLTSPRFLAIYRRILRPGGTVHLKTDDDGIFAYTQQMIDELGLNLIRSTNDLHNSPLLDDLLAVTTHYESLFLKEGKAINYLQFSFD